MIQYINIFHLNFTGYPISLCSRLILRTCESPSCCPLWALEFLLESLNGCHSLQSPIMTTLNISWGPRTFLGTIYVKQHCLDQRAAHKGVKLKSDSDLPRREWTERVQKSPSLWAGSCRPLAVLFESHLIDQKLLRIN